MTIEQLWEQFFFHLRVERRSAATLSFYEVSRQKLAVYLCGQGWPQEVPGLTVGHLRAFVLWLGEQGLNPGGQHAHVRALRALFNWCHREELIPVNPAARLALPPLPQQRLPAATGVETQRLLRAARGWDQPLRDAALILTLFDTGLRVSEVIRVTREDLQPRGPASGPVGQGRARTGPFLWGAGRWLPWGLPAPGTPSALAACRGGAAQSPG